MSHDLPSGKGNITYWVEITIRAHPTTHEAISTFLFDLGCEGLVLEDAPQHALKTYLPFREDFRDTEDGINAFLEGLREIFPDIPSPVGHFKKIEDQDWDLVWRRFFHPDRVTNQLLILPAWESLSEPFEGHVIRIDPGPAFGTGQHPTTRLCLEAMERVIPSDPWTMVDVGTGSGILAIYGGLLGAERVWAVDIDPEAIRWAERNIGLNHLGGIVQLSRSPLETWDGHFPLVSANLTLDIILTLFPHFLRILEPGGKALLSGILKEQVETLNDHLAQYPCDVDRVLVKEDWACIIAEKRK